MRRLCPLAILALGLAASALARAEEPTYTVETIGGTQLVGTLALDSVTIRSELGNLEISTETILSLTFTADGDTIVTTSGSTIKGKIQTDPFRVESDLGAFTLKRDRLKSIVARGERPAASSTIPHSEAETTEPSPSEDTPSGPGRRPPQRPIPPFLLRSSSIVSAPPAPLRPHPRPRIGRGSKGYPQARPRVTKPQ